LINRLEQSRLRLEFALAGIHRPTSHEEVASAVRQRSSELSKDDDAANLRRTSSEKSHGMV
jgi:hypothetical protein